MKFTRTFAYFFLAVFSSRVVLTQNSAQSKAVDGHPVSDHVIMFVQGGKGHTVLSLQGVSNGQPPFSLTSGTVADATTGSEIPGAIVSFKAESEEKPSGAGGAPLSNGTQANNEGTQKSAQGAIVLPSSTNSTEVNVTNLAGTTWATVSIFNQGKRIGNLDLVVLDEPLNVAVDGPGATASSSLPSTYGDTITVTLKNNSDESLALGCSVVVRNLFSSCGNIFLPPNASKAIPVDLGWGAYNWTDLVQPSVQAASLKLTARVPSGTPAEMVPFKMLPLSLTMAAVGPIRLAILSLVYIGIFLILGGYLSILASTVLPNMVHKAEIRKQVNELAQRTSSVSTRVDSYLRVLLRLERKKIQVLLDSVSGFSPDAAEQFADISNQIQNLVKRLTVAERLDKLRRAFEDRSATAPPSISDGIDKNFATAAVQLHSFVLNDTDVEAANAYFDKAEALLALLNDNDAQAKLIAQNYMQLRSRLQAFPRDYYTDLKRALSRMFDSLNFGDTEGNPTAPKRDRMHPTNADGGLKSDQQEVQDAADNAGREAGTAHVPSAEANASVATDDFPGQAPPAFMPAASNSNDFSDPKNIIAPMFFAVDHGIAAIHATLDYAIVRASIATDISKNCPDPDQGAMKRLKDHECQLLSLLGTLSWKSLRCAISLVQQMRENVYEEDIYKHIKSGKAKIIFDTQRARPFLPVFFSIAFENPFLNGAAALHSVELDWTFPNELHEAGWKTCHYFDGKEGGTAVTASQGGADLNKPDTMRDKLKRYASVKVEAKSLHWQDLQILDAKIEVQPENPKAERAGVFANRLRLAIAFGVALAGLKSGALDQLAKLGFAQATIAIIALGFGADTVKNLLTQSSRPQSSVPRIAQSPPRVGPSQN